MGIEVFFLVGKSKVKPNDLITFKGGREFSGAKKFKRQSLRLPGQVPLRCRGLQYA